MRLKNAKYRLYYLKTKKTLKTLKKALKNLTALFIYVRINQHLEFGVLIFYVRKVRFMAAKGARVKITLACTECKQRNYDTFKNKKNDAERIEIQKYCEFCKKHTAHKESK